MRLKPRLYRSTLLLILLSCAGLPRATGQPGAAPRLDYTVRIKDQASRKIHISLRLENVDTAHPLTIRSVPVYMANPVAEPADRTVVSEFTVRNPETGTSCTSHRSRPDNRDELFVIREPAKEIVIEYDVRIDFEESRQTRQYSILVPFMEPDQALLYGNYIFCFPELSEETPALAGRRLPIRVTFDLPPGLRLWGVPEQTSLHNIYQLMSLQFGWGNYLYEELTVKDLRTRLVYRKGDEFTLAERLALRDAVTAAINEVVPFFGSAAPFEHFTFFLYREEGIGGMEGTFSCQAYVYRGKDVTKTTVTETRAFLSVILHELFHAWNPIRAYPREDYWVKEGITTYYGEVLSARAGFLKKTDLDDNFQYYFRQLDRNFIIGSVRLTDPRVWKNEYLNEDWRTVTYERGSAVALLLDVSIREKTGNKKSLDDVIRFLYKSYRDASYSNDQLVAAVQGATGEDFSAFFARYVTGTKAPSRSEVEKARAKMVSLGVIPSVPTEQVPVAN